MKRITLETIKSEIINDQVGGPVSQNISKCNGSMIISHKHIIPPLTFHLISNLYGVQEEKKNLSTQTQKKK